MAGHFLDGTDFAKELSSSQGLSHPVIASGLVRKTADANVVELSPDFETPERWLKIPVSMIERVEILGQVHCVGATYDAVAIEFKWPTAPEAQVFASLLQQADATVADRPPSRPSMKELMPKHPSFTLPKPPRPLPPRPRYEYYPNVTHKPSVAPYYKPAAPGRPAEFGFKVKFPFNPK